MEDAQWLGQRASARVRKDSVGCRLEVRGYIDDEADFQSLSEALSFPLRIELSGVERINSLGVRRWLRFMADASSRGPIELIGCAEVMVDQFNQINGLVGNATVRSVMAPYGCDNCGFDEFVLVELGRWSKTPLMVLVPDRTCTECGGVSTFEHLPESYFSFLEVEPL